MQGFRIAVGAAFILALMAAALAVSCSSPGESGSRLGVVATILPLATFVEAVGGDMVDVTVMVPSGASPHTYEPTPGQMTKVSDARLYAKVGSGVEFELVWMDRVVDLNGDMLVVDCSEGVGLIETTAPHERADEGDHEVNGAADPHIWMSPVNAQVMVRNICGGLSAVDPANQGLYEANRDAYLQELQGLDRDIRATLSAMSDSVFMAYHDSFGYFAEEYGLTVLPIEVEGKEPTAASLARLIDQAREHDIKVIFASPQFSRELPDVIADAIGGRVVLVDPLAKDYVASMRMFLSQLETAMES
jgi:zinc transport system substrate-binding protein